MLQLSEEGLFFKELLKTSNKLILVLAIFVSVTDDNEKSIRVSCIHYPVQF